MKRNVQKILTILIVISLSLLIFGGFKVKAQSAKGVVTIAFDDGTQNQYDNAYPLMKARGIVGTFFVITDFIGDDSHLTVAELQDLQANGNEIGSHSESHPDFPSLTDQQIRDECSGSKQVLQSDGLTVNNFAYPYGDHNNYTDSIVTQYYRSARSAYTPPYIMSLPTSQSVLPAYPGESGDPSSWSQLDQLESAESEVDQVASNGGWVIIFFHNIIWGDYTNPYEIAAEYFENFLDYVQASDVSILTVNQALDIAGPQLSTSISPTSVNMTVGATQQFSSTVTGGTTPYSYQWYSNSTVVPGAISANWTFTPTTAGTYNIYLNATDNSAATVKSNIATAKVETPMTINITPTQVKIYIGQSQTFSSSVSGGTPPYSYQWYLNDTAVSGATASTWTFTPRSAGHYKVYLNVTDGFNFRVQSNIVSNVLVYSVYLLLTADPTQGSYSRGQTVTFTVNVFNQLDPALGSSLTLTVTGPGSYGYFDVQPISVPAGTVGEYTFNWVVPNVSGKYVVEVGLAPSMLTAYDTAWLKVN